MVHGHFVIKCSLCGRMITQCRCRAPDKEIRLSVCIGCQEEQVKKMQVPPHKRSK